MAISGPFPLPAKVLDVAAMERAIAKATPFDTVADLLAYTGPGRGVGAIWEAGGFRYQEVSSGEHLMCAGGLKLKVLRENANIFAFGAVQDDTIDDYDAFARAAASGIPKILVPAGRYFLDNAAGDRLARMAVARNTKFECETGTVLRFTGNHLPLFVWANGDGGGITGARFVFDGALPSASQFTTTQFRGRVGIPNFTGNPTELFSVIMRVGVNHNIIDDLTFESSTPGVAENGVAFCINDKGVGGGIGKTTGNKATNCRFFDCIHGVLALGQQFFEYGPFVSARRFGMKLSGESGVAPGHVLYLTGAQGGQQTISDGVVREITDLGSPITAQDGLCLAPLAVKGCARVSFGKVVSYHPEGLVQSFDYVTDCAFASMTWICSGAVGPSVSPFTFQSSSPISGNVFELVELIGPDHWFRMTCSSDLADHFQYNKIKLRVVSQHNPPDSRLPLIVLFGSNNDISLEWRPTTPADSTNYGFPVEEKNGSGNLFRISLIGPNISQASHRAIVSGPVVFERHTTANGADQLFGKNDAAMANPLSSTFGRTSTSGASGASSFTVQLPGDGVYVFTASVSYGSASFLSASWDVCFSSLGGGTADVQQRGGGATKGASLSDITATVDASGLITVSYSKASAFFAGEYGGYVKICSIGSVI